MPEPMRQPVPVPKLELVDPPGPPGPDREQWQSRAACNGADPSIWFPTQADYAKAKLAKSICQGCEVRQECLMSSLQPFEPFGIWGGQDARARRRLKRALVLSGKL